MQKLETRNGTLAFVEVPEKIKEVKTCLFIHSISWWFDLGGSISNYGFDDLDIDIQYDILGEVTREGISFDCQKYLWLHSEFNRDSMFLSMMSYGGIELREGYKFVVLKEKK